MRKPKNDDLLSATTLPKMVVSHLGCTGITTVEQLLALTAVDISRRRCVGKKTAFEIMMWLDRHGLRLTQKPWCDWQLHMIPQGKEIPPSQVTDGTRWRKRKLTPEEKARFKELMKVYEAGLAFRKQLEAIELRYAAQQLQILIDHLKLEATRASSSPSSPS